MERTMLKQIRNGLYSLIILLFISFVHTRADESSSLFPVPENLQDNVKFWTLIYTNYSSDQVVVHDSEHFIIYDVVDSDNHMVLNVNDGASWEKVKSVKKKYAEALQILSCSSKIDTFTLTPTQLKVYKLWGHIDKKNKFRNAYHNIRAQRGLSDHFRAGLERSGRYINHIERTLQDHGVPKELAALPMVESSYYYRAYSKMGAAGLWQFTRSTGRLFLSINYAIDERLDPIISTEAAAKLLKLNYEELGSWPLAITAYNHGLAGMRRAVRNLKTKDFGTIAAQYKSRSFGFASKNFYAEFIAAKNIMENYRRYFGEVNFQQPSQYIVYELPDFINLSTLLEYFDIDYTTIEELNPALRTPVLKSNRYVPKGYQLRLPPDYNLKTDAMYACIPDSHKFSAQVRDRYYKVRRGDTLSSIASQYGISTGSLMAMNNISNPNRIHVGQTIEVPPALTYMAKSESPLVAETLNKKPEDVLSNRVTIQPVFDEGKTDSIPSIAANAPRDESGKDQSNAVNADTSAISIDVNYDIAELQGPFIEPTIDLSTFSYTAPTQAATPVEDSTYFQVSFEQPKSDYIDVQPEETLGHYADWLGLQTQTLRQLNGLAYDSDIQVGQRLKISFDKVTKDEFHTRRTEYHRSIQEDFFTRFQVAGELSHTIKSGENVWYICNRLYNLPYWLLARYNPNRNLIQLHPGDKIVVPDISVRSAVKSTSKISATQNPTILNYAPHNADSAN